MSLFSSTLVQTYQVATTLTPSDTNNHNIKALYVGGAGNVSVTTNEGTTVTFTAVPVGSILPVAVQRVRATGTTATNLVGLD
jgi:hypothetical protein